MVLTSNTSRLCCTSSSSRIPRKDSENEGPLPVTSNQRTTGSSFRRALRVMAVRTWRSLSIGRNRSAYDGHAHLRVFTTVMRVCVCQRNIYESMTHCSCVCVLNKTNKSNQKRDSPNTPSSGHIITWHGIAKSSRSINCW